MAAAGASPAAPVVESTVSTPPDPGWGVQTHFQIGRVLLRILTEQLFSAKGWCVVTAVRDDKHRLVLQLEPTRMSAICSGCGETKTRFHDVKPVRQWRHIDGWGVPTLLRSVVRRVRCRHCGVRDPPDERPSRRGLLGRRQVRHARGHLPAHPPSWPHHGVRRSGGGWRRRRSAVGAGEGYPGTGSADPGCASGRGCPAAGLPEHVRANEYEIAPLRDRTEDRRALASRVLDVHGMEAKLGVLDADLVERAVNLRSIRDLEDLWRAPLRLAALDETEGNVSQAANLLGRWGYDEPHTTLRGWIARWEIDPLRLRGLDSWRR